METLWPVADELVQLAADEVHVWSVPLDRRAGTGELQALLSREELARADRYQTECLRRRFIIARGALRTLLGKYLKVSPREIVLEGDANDKPRLLPAQNPASLQFNLSHSGELALVAIARGCEVGVDVERLRAVSLCNQIARRYFHAGEADEIVASPEAGRAEKFLRCWTAKEAILKAQGIGLLGDLSSLRMPVGEHGGQWVHVPGISSNESQEFWLQTLVPFAEYIGTVAVMGEKRRLRCFTSGFPL